MLQGDEDAACWTQQQPPAQTREQQQRPEPGVSSSGDPKFLKSIQSPDAVRRSQHKVQPASRMKISRDSECHEPRVVRGSSEDRLGHSRNHVEGCARKRNKRKDTTFHDDLFDAPRQTDKHSTSWRSDVPPPCLGGSPVNTHGTPVLSSVRRPWVAQPRPRAGAGDTQASSTRCGQQGRRPPSHGSGAELRTTAVNDRAQAHNNPNNDHSASSDRR